MPKFLFKSNYTLDGVKGLLKEGGTSRRDVAQKLVEGLGGALEAFYFAYGETDVYLIADMPDDASASALSLTVSAGGGATVSTVRLLSPEDIDHATTREPDYRPPGA